MSITLLAGVLVNSNLAGRLSKRLASSEPRVRLRDSRDVLRNELEFPRLGEPSKTCLTEFGDYYKYP